MPITCGVQETNKNGLSDPGPLLHPPAPYLLISPLYSRHQSSSSAHLSDVHVKMSVGSVYARGGYKNARPVGTFISFSRSSVESTRPHPPPSLDPAQILSPHPR